MCLILRRRSLIRKKRNESSKSLNVERRLKEENLMRMTKKKMMMMKKSIKLQEVKHLLQVGNLRLLEKPNLLQERLLLLEMHQKVQILILWFQKVLKQVSNRNLPCLKLYNPIILQTQSY